MAHADAAVARPVEEEMFRALVTAATDSESVRISPELLRVIGHVTERALRWSALDAMSGGYAWLAETPPNRVHVLLPEALRWYLIRSAAGTLPKSVTSLLSLTKHSDREIELAARSALRKVILLLTEIALEQSEFANVKTTDERHVRTAIDLLVAMGTHEATFAITHFLYATPDRRPSEALARTYAIATFDQLMSTLPPRHRRRLTTAQPGLARARRCATLLLRSLND